MMRHAEAGCALSIAVLTACGETGREHFEIALFSKGTAAREVEVEGGTMRLREARVTLGPLYLCATESAETEFCETALAEWLAADSVDVLSAKPRHLGDLDATTGTVQSGFFDYGISWLLADQAPRRSEEGGGHSATLVFDVRADSGSALEVRANIDIAPIEPGDFAVNALRTVRELKANDSLTMVFDPNAWLRRVRIADLLALDADGDGQVRLDENTQAYEAIIQGMTANATPVLEWR